MEQDEARELARRLAVLIGMIMEDVVDGAIFAAPADQTQLSGQLEALGQAGNDICKLVAAADVVIRRYDHPQSSHLGSDGQ